MRVSNSLSLASLALIAVSLTDCRRYETDDSVDIEVAPGTTSMVLTPVNEVDGVQFKTYVSFPKDVTLPLKAVIVMHGSGGQWVDEDTNGDGIADKCDSGILSRQFTEWRDILNSKGHVVVNPDGYSARGTCENEGDYKLPPLKFKISGTFIRPSDLYATLDALKHLVSTNSHQPVIDMNNVIVLGFSDGGSAAIASLFDVGSSPKGWSWSQTFDGVKYTQEIKPPTKRMAAKGIKAGVVYYPGSYHNGYYGNLCKTGEGIYSSYCDILFHLPSDDPLSANTECLLSTMAANGGGHATVFRYDGVGHSFDSNVQPASELARERTLQFIESKFAE